MHFGKSSSWASLPQQGRLGSARLPRVSKAAPLRCAACSLCWHRLLQTPPEDLELLNRWEGRSLNRALERMRVTFPSQYDEPSVLLTRVSSQQIVSLLCTSWSRSFHLLSPKNIVPLSPVTHSSKTVTIFFCYFIFMGLKIREVSNRVKRNTLLTSCKNPLQKANICNNFSITASMLGLVVTVHSKLFQ